MSPFDVSTNPTWGHHPPILLGPCSRRDHPYFTTLPSSIPLPLTPPITQAVTPTLHPLYCDPPRGVGIPP
eukprot:767499-Hanusia_phi.AAC.5